MVALFRSLMVLGVALNTIVPRLGAQRLDSIRIGVSFIEPSADTIPNTAPTTLLLSGKCQVSRTVAAGAAGYLGFLIGQLAQFPLALSSNSNESIAIDVAGAVAAVILFADAPLSRPLPFCPAEMRTLANGPRNHIAACRASRILSGGLGAAAGAVVASAIAIPFVLSHSEQSRVNGLFIVLPAAGAIGGAIRAGRVAPCRP